MRCQVRSPDQIVFEGESTMVVARGTQGEFAVMDDHAPLLAALRGGPLRIKTTDTDHVFACFGGTLRVAEDRSVTVLVDEAIALSDIDAALEESSEGDIDARREVLLRVKETYG